MLRFLACSLMFFQGVSAGDLATDFDPISEIVVSDSQVIVGEGEMQSLSQGYGLVHLTVATNTGTITSSIHDDGGKISLPDNVDFIVTSSAAGTSYEVSIKDQKSWKTLIATSQKNVDAEVLSVGNFQVEARDNEARFIRATGNKIIYQNKNSE